MKSSKQLEQQSKRTLSEVLSHITWLQLLIYLEVLVALTIFIFPMIGVAIGYDVSLLFLLSLLQFFITIPGCVFSQQRAGLFLVVYISLQAVTGVSEIVWLVAHVVKKRPWAPSVGLGLLILVQLVSLIVTIFFRDRTVFKRPKRNLETHLSYCSERDMKLGGTRSELSNRPVQKATVSEEDDIQTRSTQPSDKKAGMKTTTLENGSEIR